MRFARAWSGFGFLAVAMALLLFGSAGTVDYWQAWAYLGIFFGPTLLITLWLARNDPALLERRSSAGSTAEREPSQKIVAALAQIGFTALLVVPALDHRFGWSQVPRFAIVSGEALTVVCFSIVFTVFRENTFSSATIEIAAGQTVISTGPYARVRHPMYAGALLLLLGTPPALGSFWGLPAAAFLSAAIVWRLLDEERLLAKDLPGYRDYCRRVRWRLIPGIF